MDPLRPHNGLLRTGAPGETDAGDIAFLAPAHRFLAAKSVFPSSDEEGNTANRKDSIDCAGCRLEHRDIYGSEQRPGGIGDWGASTGRAVKKCCGLVCRIPLEDPLACALDGLLS